MALAAHIKCVDCGTATTVRYTPTHRIPETCSDCDERRLQILKKMKLAQQAALPLEDRLAAIEEFIYDHKEVKHGYIPAPRF